MVYVRGTPRSPETNTRGKPGCIRRAGSSGSWHQLRTAAARRSAFLPERCHMARGEGPTEANTEACEAQTARHGTRLLSREGETGDQSCVVPSIVHSPVPSTLSPPYNVGQFPFFICSFPNRCVVETKADQRPAAGWSLSNCSSRASPRSVRAWRARRLGHLRPADFALLLELLHVCKHIPTKMHGTLNFARAPLCRGWAGGRASVPQSGVWLCFSRNALPTLIFRTLAPTSP